MGAGDGAKGAEDGADVGGGVEGALGEVELGNEREELAQIGVVQDGTQKCGAGYAVEGIFAVDANQGVARVEGVVGADDVEDLLGAALGLDAVLEGRETP